MAEPGQLALVTGTSSGIGEAVAAELLSRGWRVLGLSRRAASFDESRYTHIEIDLGDGASLKERIPARVGGLLDDPELTRLALVNNAASPGLLGPVTQLDPEALLRVYAVNVAAPVWLMGWLVRETPTTVPLRIVNVTSIAGLAPYPGLGAYGGSKAALRMAGMVLAAELAAESGPARDITILSYSPGAVDTPMQAEARATPVERFPLAETFQQAAADGRLTPPSAPAAEIADYLEDDGYPAFHEGHLGEPRKP